VMGRCYVFREPDFAQNRDFDAKMTSPTSKTHRFCGLMSRKWGRTEICNILSSIFAGSFFRFFGLGRRSYCRINYLPLLKFALDCLEVAVATSRGMLNQIMPTFSSIRLVIFASKSRFWAKSGSLKT